MTNKDIMAQLKEMKRLADLKAEKEKSEKSLHKILNPATIRVQAQKMVEYEAKRKKMFDEYNHQITHRGNDPLNLTVYERFILKTLGFSEWLEAKALGIPPPPELSTFGILVDDRKRKKSSEILKEVFVKENIVVDRIILERRRISSSHYCSADQTIECHSERESRGRRNVQENGADSRG
ncbi:hypothetical protein Tco_0250876 [Tanacetum coccineum]